MRHLLDSVVACTRGFFFIMSVIMLIKRRHCVFFRRDILPRLEAFDDKINIQLSLILTRTSLYPSFPSEGPSAFIHISLFMNIVF